MKRFIAIISWYVIISNLDFVNHLDKIIHFALECFYIFSSYKSSHVQIS